MVRGGEGEEEGEEGRKGKERRGTRGRRGICRLITLSSQRARSLIKQS
jgi:hypothetical protein